MSQIGIGVSEGGRANRMPPHRRDRDAFVRGSLNKHVALDLASTAHLKA